MTPLAFARITYAIFLAKTHHNTIEPTNSLTNKPISLPVSSLLDSLVNTLNDLDGGYCHWIWIGFSIIWIRLVFSTTLRTRILEVII